jgi:hypothetical protein
LGFLARNALILLNRALEKPLSCIKEAAGRNC